MRLTQQYQQYLDSFRQKKILPVFLIDFLFYGVLFLLTFIYGLFIRQKSLAIAGIQSAEQLQQMLLSSPEQAQLFLESLKSFMFVFVVGAVLLVLFLVLGYSYTRKMIWNYLLRKKSKKFGRWVGLNFALVILLIFYLVIIVIVRIILNYPLSLISQQTLSQFLGRFLSLTSLLIFLTFIYLVYYSFTVKDRVWESIGDAFSLIRTKRGQLWKFFLLVLATGIIINLLLAFIPKLITYFFIHPMAFSLLNTGLFLLFLAWLRVYLVRTIHEH